MANGLNIKGNRTGGFSSSQNWSLNQIDGFPI